MTLAAARRQVFIYLEGVPYRLVPGSYQVEALPRFSAPLRLGAPRYEHVFPETIVAQSSWHKGWGQGRMGDPEMYAIAEGVDASLPGLITLAPPVELKSGAYTNVSAFALFQGAVYAAAGTSLLRYDAAAGAWTAVATLPSPITDLQVFHTSAGLRLAIGQESGNFRYYDGANLSDAGAPAVLLAVVNEALWRAYFHDGMGWSVAKSADGATWGGPVRIGRGDERPTAMLVYESRLFITTPSGIWAVSNDGASENLLPDLSLAPSPSFGRGSAVHNNVVYIPAGASLLEWQSEAVTATGAGRMLAASEPFGLEIPEATRGTYAAVRGVTGRTVMALLNGPSD